jgi:anti-anti-sigma regulatory factor
VLSRLARPLPKGSVNTQANLEKREVIRIHAQNDGPHHRLIVEGTLSDGWVESLELAWLDARSETGGMRLSVDLSGLTYVDDRGRDLLVTMVSDGAELCGTGIMTTTIIQEVATMTRECATAGRPETNQRRSNRRNRT